MSLKIGTAEAQSTFHVQGLALAEALKQLGDDYEVFETPTASTGNAKSLGTGEIDLGFMAANWVPKALNADAPFDSPIDLRLVAPMNVGPLFFVTQADRPLGSLMDLRGKRVALGAENSGMHQHAQSIFGALGSGLDLFEPVFLDFRRGADALLAGEVDAQFQPPIPNPIMDDLARQREVRAIAPTADELNTVTAAVAHYRRTSLPAGAFRGHDTDMPQLGVVNVLVAHASQAEATVARITEQIVAKAAWLAKRDPLFITLPDLLDEMRRDGALGLGRGLVSLHAGAAKAYQSLGFAA